MTLTYDHLLELNATAKLLADFEPTADDWAECFLRNPIAPPWVEAVEGVSQEEIAAKVAASGEPDPFAGI